jgi:hypothetical protein
MKETHDSLRKDRLSLASGNGRFTQLENFSYARNNSNLRCRQALKRGLNPLEGAKAVRWSAQSSVVGVAGVCRRIGLEIEKVKMQNKLPARRAC